MVSIVPCPSLSIEPPSRTKLRRFSRRPGRSPRRSRTELMRLSRSAANLRPQPLNLKSIATYPPGVSTVIGPKSRAHVSLVGQSTNVTADGSKPQASKLPRHSPEGPATITGVSRDISRIIPAKHLTVSASIGAQSVSLWGHAIRTARCGSHSAGRRRFVALSLIFVLVFQVVPDGIL